MRDQLMPNAADQAGLGTGRVRTIYLDMTDLVDYLKVNITVSGIQRVVVNLILNAPDAGAAHGVDVVLAFPDYARSKIYSVNRADVLAMLTAMDTAGDDREKLDAAIAAIYKNRKLVFPHSGDVFTIAGAFWIYDNYDLLMTLRRSGVGIVNFIHDLIQISNPEFVFADATRVFRRTLVDVLSSSTGILTNSEYVAQDVRGFLKRRTDISIPVQAVPLATELVPRKNADLELSHEVTRLLSTRYVLSVSTIEVRKNHAFTVRVWKSLIDMGVENLPDLVFVGKIGWDIHPFLKFLEETDYLGGKVHILNHVSDEELAELYRHAQFTMYMSFVEGFGLPVAESLAYGVPCISSGRSSMPEVGGRFARYVDPEDVVGAIELVRSLVENPEELAAWRQDVTDHFTIRTWREFTLNYVAALLAVPTPEWQSCNNIFHPNEIYGMGRWEVARRDASGERLSYLASSRLDGWHSNEDWGCWTASRRASVALATSLPEGTLLTAFAMVEAPRDLYVKLEIISGEETIDLGAIVGDAAWRSFDCEVGRNGMLELTLKVNGSPLRLPDRRDLFVGLHGLAFCMRHDIAARLALVERLALDRSRMGSPPQVQRPQFEISFGKLGEVVDAKWYRDYYPDVQLVGMSAQDHYDWIGKRLGRKPNRAALEQGAP